MKKLSDLEKEYHVSHYLLLTVLLFIIQKLFLAYHASDPFSGSGSIVYIVNSVLSAIAIFLILGLAIGVTVIPKSYKKQTGRNYWYDRKHYMRPYKELVEYFRDADPGKMDIEDLPEMNWRESSGLIFGKVGNRLLSYEPGRDGIIAMIWGAPGDGKTTSTIIPSCRQFGLIRSESGQIRQEGAVMVTDLKGDIYAANRDYRHIKRFSTMDWKNSAHYDPLCNARNMKISDRAIYLENLAITIVPDEESSESKYFTDGARDFFSGISLRFFTVKRSETPTEPPFCDQSAVLSVCRSSCFSGLPDSSSGFFPGSSPSFSSFSSFSGRSVSLASSVR